MHLQRTHVLRLILLITSILSPRLLVQAQTSDDVFPNELNSDVEEPQIALPEVNSNSPFRNVSRTRRKDTNDKLVLLCQEAVETTARRLLSTDQHTPWQMMHALLGLRQDFQMLHQGQTISGLDWIKQGQVFENEYWFERTKFGGRAHPYNRPYAFEGHANQFLAILSMCGVPLDQRFSTATGDITMRDMVQNAQMTLTDKDEPTWTLWALSRYLPPGARWRNAAGEFWSIEKLVQQQCAKPVVRGAPCGGTHALFALAHARNVYLRQGKPLRGVWLQAEYKLRRYINTARMQQNSNGSLSSNFFRGRKYDQDFNKRMASSGHVLEFLMIALPQKELNSRWVRRAIESAAQDLLNNRKAYVKCSPLYHSVDALNIYLDRVNPKLSPDQIAKLDRETRTAEAPKTAPANGGLKPVPFTNISKERELAADKGLSEEDLEKTDVVKTPKMKVTDIVAADPSLTEISTPEPSIEKLPLLTKEQLRAAIEDDRMKWSATPENRRTPIVISTNKAKDDEQPAVELPAAKVEEPQPKNEMPAIDETGPETSSSTDRDDESEQAESTSTNEGDDDVEKPTPESTEDEAATDTEEPAAEAADTGVPAKSVSMTSPVAADSIGDVEADQASEIKAVVPSGINDVFLDTELNVAEWLEKLEVESREVYAARATILEAVGIDAGMSVADIGSGTGLFLKPFADAVGPTGRVYAIDISPRFVAHLEQRVDAEELSNVNVVRNGPKSLMLMKHKVDRAFICDTYHHFEYHKEMLESTFDALRPGGELILVDFRRIPGESREWVLNHVRADRETFKAEVEAAGFEYVEDVAIEEFKENYLMRFRRPDAL